MSAFLVAFLVGLGVGTWVFTKLNQRTGYGNAGNAFKGAGVAALVVFLVVLSLAKLLIHTS